MDKRAIGLRQVLIVSALVVVTVLGLQLMSLLVPGFAEVLGVMPLLIVVLVVVTALVLMRAVRPRV